MDRSTRSRIAVGLILVLLGGWFLLVQLVPSLGEWINIEFTWPWTIIAVGVLLLVIGLLTGVPALAIPASIVGGIGGLLYWQNATGNWESWAYAWTLIPGFVGVGILLNGLLGGDDARGSVRGGLWLMFISLILFVAFGSLLGDLGGFSQFWPVLLILFGIYLLVRAVFWRRSY
ncbi:MAG: hypothetical protein EHM70_20205 [Chloroflexota bacterium]|nr:MAG: hypothetical protein EHM70_20205 [Chloroflexota bacterium]